jgi:hypothetical protein
MCSIQASPDYRISAGTLRLATTQARKSQKKGGGDQPLSNPDPWKDAENLAYLTFFCIGGLMYLE